MQKEISNPQSGGCFNHVANELYNLQLPPARKTRLKRASEGNHLGKPNAQVPAGTEDRRSYQSQISSIVSMEP